MTGRDWTDGLKERLAEYLAKLQIRDQIGHYRPAVDGITPEGQQIGLGFSCYAHKVYYSLGLWDDLTAQEQVAWLDFIRSYQVGDNMPGILATEGAFVDRGVVAYLSRSSRRRRIKRLFSRASGNDYLNKVIIAETKQAIATLSQVKASPFKVYMGFPQTVEDTRLFLSQLDWTQPWGAGANAAHLAVLFDTQAREFLPEQTVSDLQMACCQFLEGRVDKQTGAYFEGSVPEYGQLINGAMKVLTALDWLDTPIHYPEQLIDTCLFRLPESEGCHLVDAVYVAYRCVKQTNYRRQDIQDFYCQILDMIGLHYTEAGGFSYYINRSQQRYYEVPITVGLPVADIHGTVLLTWALAMIFDVLGTQTEWRVIRP